ncbi:MAG: hypothetical protein ACI9P8_002154, partial [Bacteroidia bacterium]
MTKNRPIMKEGETKGKRRSQRDYNLGFKLAV